MYARKQFKWVEIRKTYGHSVDMYVYVLALKMALEMKTGCKTSPQPQTLNVAYASAFMRS